MSLIIVIGLKTPIEVWIDHKSSYSSLKCFRCAFHARVKEDKLSGKAIKCIFFEYLDGVKG